METTKHMAGVLFLFSKWQLYYLLLMVDLLYRPPMGIKRFLYINNLSGYAFGIHLSQNIA